MNPVKPFGAGGLSFPFVHHWDCSSLPGSIVALHGLNIMPLRALLRLAVKIHIAVIVGF